MKKYFITTLSLILFLYSSYSQYCIDGGPTSTIDSNVDTVLLIGETSTIDYMGCPGVLGVQDLTAYIADLSVDSTYSLYVHFSTCGNNYNGAGQVWIDFDHSESFDLFESIGTWVGKPPVPIDTFIFTVPSYAIAGETRMRIIQQEGGSINLDPCATFQWGSVMDFKINIPNGINCAGYVGDRIIDPIEVNNLPYSNNNSNSKCYTNQMTLYDSPDIYYRILPDTTIDSLKVSLCESDFDTYLTILNKNDSVIFYNDDAATCTPHSEVLFPVNGLDTIYAVVQGWNLDTGNFTIDISVHSYISSTIDEIENIDINIYPNPAYNYIQITGVDFNMIEMSDIKGEIVYQEKTAERVISLPKLNTGIYFINIFSSDNIYRRKLIIR